MSDDKQISVRELESYFRSAQLPTQPFQLNPSHRVNDIRIFLESHFGPLRGKDLPLSHIDRPIYDRLVEFKNYLEKA